MTEPTISKQLPTYEEDCAIVRDFTDSIIASWEGGLASRGLVVSDGYSFVVGISAPSFERNACTIVSTFDNWPDVGDALIAMAGEVQKAMTLKETSDGK